MPMKIEIITAGRDRSYSAAWAQIFKSDGMKAVVDAAGERISAEAGPYYSYKGHMGNYAYTGKVSANNKTASIFEQKYKTLSRAVHP